MHRCFLPRPWFLLGILIGLWGCQSSESDRAHRVRFESGASCLTVEVLDDDLVHFELAPVGMPGAAARPISSTAMVLRRDYSGPTRIDDDGQGTLETPELRIQVDLQSLAITITDLTKEPPARLTGISPLGNDRTGLRIEQHRMQQVYGLGQEFIRAYEPNGDWVGRKRTPGCEFGNALVAFDEAASSVGNTQIPVLFAIGPDAENYGMFVDDPYAQSWDFSLSNWTLETTGEALRWYFISGPNLPDLRSDYMELVGRPPVPPRKMFGLWVSEYGYDDWAEMEDKLRTLRERRFPVDGFFLDLQWFGGVTAESESTRMGTLSWDQARFPEAARKIAALRDEQGVGVIPIEEPYVGGSLDEHRSLREKGFLACAADGGGPVRLSSWWGVGGMIDWTNPAAGDAWHDWKRRPLVDAGVIGHWTDLGEPETFDRDGRYYGCGAGGGAGHCEVHNLYNYHWAESIARGYERDGKKRRPFILSRSGTAGIQRFGAALWSGDIGSRLSQLAPHLNAQMHMSMSGIDYFGSDVGGFRREALDGDLNDLYTRWFANSCLIDVPVRPHAANTENRYETAPDRVGDVESNLANIRLRYELIPYLYSLAHRAQRFGEPVFAPLVFYHQDDIAIRALGEVKMVGRDLVASAVTQHDTRDWRIFLPAGWWINYHTDQWHRSRSHWLRGVSMDVNGRLMPPLFARAGAIIPQMFVDAQTMNAFGRRLEGTRRDELVIRVYGDEAPSEFTLYEDDGETTAYLHGAVRTTRIAQVVMPGEALVTIDGAEGDYEAAPAGRDNVIRLVTNYIGDLVGVTFSGEALPELGSFQEFESAQRGWHKASLNVWMARSGQADVKEAKAFRFEFTAE